MDRGRSIWRDLVRDVGSLFRAVPAAPDPLEFPIAPPENWVFTARMPAPTFQISPDGRHLAVVASSEGVAMLWVRPIAKPAWRQLPETQGAEGPFWSPDSQSLGFFANDRLKTVRVSGGAPVVICEARVGQVPGGAWSHNGVILFGGAGPLWKVGVSGGHATSVATLGPGEIAHRWPSFLPDGEHFLYLAQLTAGVNCASVRSRLRTLRPSARTDPMPSTRQAICCSCAVGGSWRSPSTRIPVS